MSRPHLRRHSRLVVLYGKLAPMGAIAKFTGKKGLRFCGSAAEGAVTC